MKMPYETILSDVKRSSKHCSLTESATIYRNDGPTGGSKVEDPTMVGCYGGLLTVPYTAGVETVERGYKYKHETWIAHMQMGPTSGIPGS